MASDDGLQEPAFERLSDSPNLSETENEKSSRKRKRDKVTRSSHNENIQKAQKKRLKTVNDEELDLEHSINKAFSHMDNQLLADYIAQRTRNFEKDLSYIELADIHIAASSIRDTTSWSKPRILSNLPGFLENFSLNPTKLWSASKKAGAPHTIIVTGAGLRAADVARTVRKFQTKDVSVAKLFAKHLKLKDQISFLQKKRVGKAVGTPLRLDELMSNGALATDRLERIVVDVSHIDVKKRGVLEMKDVHAPLMKWLNRADLKDRLGRQDTGIDLLFF